MSGHNSIKASGYEACVRLLELYVECTATKCGTPNIFGGVKSGLVNLYKDLGPTMLALGSRSILDGVNKDL